MNASSSRKLVYLNVPYQDVLEMMQRTTQGYSGIVHLPVSKSLPKGCKVLDCREDFLTRTFLFLVEHESFPEVPDGSPIPYYHTDFELSFYIAVEFSVDSEEITQLA